MPPNCNRGIGFWLLTLLISFHLLNNIFFLIQNPLPDGKDSYAHLSAFLNFKQIINGANTHHFYDANKGLLYKLIFGTLDYPPFFIFCAFLLDFLFGNVYANAAMFTSTLAFAMLIFFTYKIGEAVMPKSGILAAFICSFYPIMFYSSRHFNIEMTLAAVVCAAMLCLLKTGFFETRRFSVIFGIILGIGMLTKQTFIIYLLGPLCVTTYFFLFKGSSLSQRKRSINLLLAILCAFFVSLIFYHNKEVYANLFNRSQFIGAVENSSIFSFRQLVYYPASFLRVTGWFLSCIFLYAMVFFVKIDNYTRSYLLSWLVCPLFFLSLFVLKYGEYMIAFLPAAALISSLGILKTNSGKPRVFLIGAVILVCLYNYFGHKKENFFYSRFAGQWDILSIDGRNDSETFDKKTCEIIKFLGDKDINIGMFYNHRNYFFNDFFLKRLFSFSQKKAKVVDATDYPVVFFAKLDSFDELIFISDCEKIWLDEQSFSEYKRQVNENRYTKLEIIDAQPGKGPYGDINASYIPEELIRKLFALKEKYRLEHIFEFLEAGKSRYAYFYRRVY